MNEYDNLQTMTGVPVEEIPAKMMEHLPPDAYKAIDGGNLTDINTGYMLERITAVFGLRGLGWDLRWNKEDMVIYGEPVSQDYRRSEVLAHLKFATFVFVLFNKETGEPVEIKLPTSGMSANSILYAEEGARSNAISTAVKTLCFQLDVYKGILDHNNANAEAKKNSEQKEMKFDFRTAHPAYLNRARERIIPQGFGTPFDGKSLGDVLKEPLLGPSVIGYLAGELVSPRTKKLFVPANGEQESLQKAALYLWIHGAKELLERAQENQEEEENNK